MNVRLLELGRRPYREVWQLQHRLHAAIREGSEPDTWIVVEHDPVITLGRQANERNLLLSAPALAARGIDVVRIERGGDVTYHGPGQLVVYPIRRLGRFREVVPLVRSLERAVLNTAARFGVRGEQWSDHAGVWVGGKQLCAIGLAIRNMVSLHGIALNVAHGVDYRELINPCGLSDRGVTSLEQEAGCSISLAQAQRILLAELAATFDVTFEPACRELVA